MTRNWIGRLSLRTFGAALLCALFTVCLQAQMPPQSAGGAQASQPQPSPAATAMGKVAGGTIHVAYSAPHMRGRKIMGELVPYGEVWRTGANAATTMVTSVPLKFGTLLVPAGTYTLYTLPG